MDRRPRSPGRSRGRACAGRRASADGSRRRRRRHRAALADPSGHGHGLGGGGGLVQQRGVGQLQPGQVDDHLLEGEQGLEAALADLGLIGRVRRVPAGVLEHVALDHRRRDRVVVAHADHRDLDPVALGHPPQGRQRRPFVERGRQSSRALGADRGGRRLVDEIRASAPRPPRASPRSRRIRPDVPATNSSARSSALNVTLFRHARLLVGDSRRSAETGHVRLVGCGIHQLC